MLISISIMILFTDGVFLTYHTLTLNTPKSENTTIYMRIQLIK